MSKSVVISEVVNEAWRQAESYEATRQAWEKGFNELSSEGRCSEVHLTKVSICSPTQLSKLWQGWIWFNVTVLEMMTFGF